MKRLLCALLMVVVSQGSLLQGCGGPEACVPICLCTIVTEIIAGSGEQYAFLKELPQDSKIGNECMGLRRALIWKGTSEMQCDQLEADFATIALKERDRLLKEFEDKDSRDMKILLPTDVLLSMTAEKKLEILNSIGLLLPNISNEEKIKEFNLLVLSSHKMAVNEVFRRAQEKEKKEFKEQLCLDVKKSTNS